MSFWAEINKIPPVTRFLCASSLVVTIPVILQFISLYPLLFVRHSVITKWEIWRLWTSFFIGNTNITYIFDFFMLYRTSDQLESSRYSHRNADYAWQIFLASIAIVVLNLPLNSYTHGRALVLALIYLHASLSPPGTQASLFGLISFPIVYLPYTTLAIDVLQGGPQELPRGLSGILVGHIWWWGIWGGTRAGREGRGGDREGSLGILGGIGKAGKWMKSWIGPGSSAGPKPRTGAVRPPPTEDEAISGVHVMAPRRTVPIGNEGRRRNAQTASTGDAETSGYRWGSGNTLG